MKERILNILITAISIFVLIELLIQKSIIYSSIMYALNMWVNNLIPSLFPFFIISDILINYNITSYIPETIRALCKQLFNINDSMFIILVLSMIAGFPSNARNTRMLYEKGLISDNEANHILMFSHFANPVFILTTVAIFFFNNQQMGIVLLVIHYLSNFILGFLLRFTVDYNCSNLSNDNIHHNFGSIFTSAIKRAIDTTLTICGIVIVFLMLSTIIINYFNFDVYNQMIIKGLFEITIGLEALGKLSIGLNYKLVIASMILAFGGISVHVQVLSQIADTKIKYQYFLIGRIYQMVIASLLAYLWCLVN